MLCQAVFFCKGLNLFVIIFVHDAARVSINQILICPQQRQQLLHGAQLSLILIDGTHLQNDLFASKAKHISGIIFQRAIDSRIHTVSGHHDPLRCHTQLHHCILFRLRIEKKDDICPLHAESFLEVTSFYGFLNFLPFLPPDAAVDGIGNQRLFPQPCRCQMQEEKEIVLVMKVQNDFFLRIFQQLLKLRRQAKGIDHPFELVLQPQLHIRTGKAARHPDFLNRQVGFCAIFCLDIHDLHRQILLRKCTGQTLHHDFCSGTHTGRNRGIAGADLVNLHLILRKPPAAFRNSCRVFQILRFYSFHCSGPQDRV